MDVHKVIEGCLQNDRRAQERLFQLYYGKLIVVALHVELPVGKSVTSVLLFFEPVPLGVVLDHRSHGSVVYGNTRRKERRDVFTNTVTAADEVGE